MAFCVPNEALIGSFPFGELVAIGRRPGTLVGGSARPGERVLGL